MMRRLTFVLALLLIVCPLSAQQGQQQGQQQQRVVPEPVNVRLTFMLIQADGFTDDDPEIRTVVTELRKLFRFRGYRLASKSVLQAATPGSVRQQVTDPDGQVYTIEASVTMSGQPMRVIDASSPGSQSRIVMSGDAVQLSVSLSVPGGNGTLIQASVSLKNGKTVVLGSAQRNSESKAVILVVTPVIDP